MNLLWTASAWDDYLYWQRTDPDVLTRLNALVRDAHRSPFAGLGKPEPLKGSLKGWWSRRITAEHRLVYRIVGFGEGQRLEIVQCRYHY
ncbi:Txe/YoeB family addiction module toxin [Magnetospirillum moscoviense]|uniref:Putative mRNA interferase YoeB n=1 Tax=Magnetospirillum moscoviense TaxID=1437059 RepID=A0A178N1D1_9PROT|nr:Txe/YoeB family addiction module toxin [Magnetospirillum moscoviense]MBF0324846.1 Txe/YoeB family addiction module toxin [Alphaproteobacteria bacterium]OAN63217.1 addiction module protein [Magnetospirillum moscoviense]